MKKLIFALTIISLASCSKPDINTTPPPTPVTNCYKVTEVRVVRFLANGTISDTGFVPNGAKAFYSNNAADCDEVFAGGYSTNSGTTETQVRYIGRCN